MAGAWIVLLMLEPDFGMALVYAFALGMTMILAGVRWRHLALVLILLVPLVAVVALRHSYVADRIAGFLDPAADPFGKGWHLLQCQHALARGGLWGTGWGGALWAHAYLPLAHSDSAYAAMAEALGWTGCVPVVVLFPLLAWFSCRMAAKSADPVARLYVQAFSLTIVAQGLLHLSVNTGLLPVTGVTLPFFSYGGSSLLSLMFGFGILISAAAARQGAGNAATPGMTQPHDVQDVP
jgi:cell division protein FtsW (lipid II flippase)